MKVCYCALYLCMNFKVILFCKCSYWLFAICPHCKPMISLLSCSPVPWEANLSMLYLGPLVSRFLGGFDQSESPARSHLHVPSHYLPRVPLLWL